MTGDYRVVGRTERFRGRLFSVVSDRVRMPTGDEAQRDYLRHVGAVAVVPYQDSTDDVLLVCQYRHAVGDHLWELPAGLRDVSGERLPEVAVRELAEEVDLVCDRLHVLLDLHPSPGCSDERIRVFLARGLAPSPRPYHREHEEATMQVAWYPLDEAVAMALAGRITNAAAVAGVLATAHARDHGWQPLRPADAA